MSVCERMQTSIERIKQSIQAAKKEGSEAGTREKFILCADADLLALQPFHNINIINPKTSLDMT